MTPVDAGHPDYDSEEFDNPDDYKPSSGMSFRASDIASIAMLLYSVEIKQGNEEYGDKPFAVAHARFCEDAQRLTTKGGETVSVSAGEPFSFSTGAGQVIPVFKKLIADGKVRAYDDPEHVRGVFGQIVKGKATKGNPPLSFVLSSVDEQKRLRDVLAAADAGE